MISRAPCVPLTRQTPLLLAKHTNLARRVRTPRIMFPLKVDLEGDKAVSLSKTSIARCFPFHATPGENMPPAPPAESSCARRSHLADRCRAGSTREMGLGLGGHACSGKLDGPDKSTS